MNTFIISSKNENAALEKTNSLLSELNINKFDSEEGTYEKDLKIEDVRNIKKKIYLKPLKSEYKANIFILKKGATIEAQNALLKILEEPPKSTLLYIVVQNHHIFLPTIISRAKIIEIKNEEVHDPEGFREIQKIKEEGDGLFLAQNLTKDKSKAIKWLEDTLLETRIQMLLNLDETTKTKKYQKQIKLLEGAYKDLKNTNVNTRLTLENLFLNI